MKELIKKRWFLVTFGILAIISILAIVVISFWGVLYLKGFRFVYPEQFENSWNAVSGIAAWAGVVVSVISVLASSLAIVFAVRVADKQNKIELLDRRLNCYNELAKHIDFAVSLKKCKDKKEVVQYFKHFFELPINIDLSALPPDFVKENKNALYQFPFIFHGITRFEIYDVYESFLILVKALLQENSDFEDAKQKYIQIVLGFSEKHINIIKEKLYFKD